MFVTGFFFFLFLDGSTLGTNTELPTCSHIRLYSNRGRVLLLLWKIELEEQKKGRNKRVVIVSL